MVEGQAFADSGPSVAAAEARYSDVELLRRMALRDQGAFDLFYRRHERLLFGLALHLARDPLSAEEAFQNAMVRIWLSAGNFRMEGNARGWMTRILARECLKKRRRRRHAERSLGDHPEEEVSLGTACVEELPERAERVALLRKVVLEFTLEEQRILALHFAGGLTQVEIGRILSLPQTTVSRRLARSLEQLRSRLAGMAGFGLAGVEELLGLAVLPAVATPVRLHALVRSLICRTSRRGLGLGLHPGRIPVLVAICAVAAGLGLEWATGSPAAAPAHGREDAASLALHTAGQGGVAPRTRLYAKWSCRAGIPEDLKPILGSWSHWDPGRQGLAPAAVSRWGLPNAVGFEIPFKIPPVPLRIRARVRIPSAFRHMGPTDATLQGAWCSGIRTIEPRRKLWHRERFSTEGDRPYHQCVWFYRELVLDMVEEASHPASVFVYGRPYPSQRIIVMLAGQALEEVSIEEVGEAELPGLLREPEALQRLIDADPGRWEESPNIALKPAWR